MADGTRNGPTIYSFFVFNPELGKTEETEHEKILFYYPPDIPINEKQSNVGLSEALIGFASSFSEEIPCEAVHLQKSRKSFFNCEPHIWIVMDVKNPYITRVSKESGTEIEYLEDELQNSVLQSIIQQAYSMFKLFNGTFTNIMDKFSVKTLRYKLDLFMPQYISTISFDKSDLFTTLNGIHFLPVDKNIYLRIQCFINLTENTFSQIKYSSFLYKDHLVWSGLEQDDMRVLYKYLVSYLNSDEDLLNFLGSPDFIEHVQNTTGKTDSTNTSFTTVKTSNGFITGPQDLKNPDTPINAPKIFIGPNDEEYHLIVYELFNITVLFLIEPSALMKLNFYVELDKFIAPQFKNLAAIIGEQYSKKQSYDDHYRYIYFNHMNLALKTSLKQKGATLSKETMQILLEMHQDFEKSPENVAEVFVKTQNDLWLLGRKSDKREFFVIFDRKDANLIEISEEVKKLSSTYFNSIFIGIE